MGHNQPISFHKRMGEKLRELFFYIFQSRGKRYANLYGGCRKLSVSFAVPLLVYGHFLVGPNQAALRTITGKVISRAC